MCLYIHVLTILWTVLHMLVKLLTVKSLSFWSLFTIFVKPGFAHIALLKVFFFRIGDTLCFLSCEGILSGWSTFHVVFSLFNLQLFKMRKKKKEFGVFFFFFCLPHPCTSAREFLGLGLLQTFFSYSVHFWRERGSKIRTLLQREQRKILP